LSKNLIESGLAGGSTMCNPFQTGYMRCIIRAAAGTSLRQTM
jgi:hypothetical protein